VLSGELAAPGLPQAAETAFMARLVNSYGKTWHTWHTGRHDGAPGHRLPYGDPKLMWSFNRDGEAQESLKENRDRSMRLDTAAKRAARQRLLDQAHPQCGVDAMRGDFPNSTPITGVVDLRSAGPMED
jgi:hypothetical protein